MLSTPFYGKTSQKDARLCSRNCPQHQKEYDLSLCLSLHFCSLYLGSLTSPCHLVSSLACTLLFPAPTSDARGESKRVTDTAPFHFLFGPQTFVSGRGDSQFKDSSYCGLSSTLSTSSLLISLPSLRGRYYYCTHFKDEMPRLPQGT